MSKPPPPWSRDEADQFVAAYEASGLTVAEFARQHDLPAQRLYWARRRRRATKHAPAVAIPTGFSEVTVVEDRAEARAAIELRLPSGLSILVTRDFDDVALRRVLGLLAAC